MYKVYADDILIHDNQSPDKSVHLIDPQLEMEDCAAGSFSFTMTKTNLGYNNIRRLHTTIKIQRDDKTIWIGRVITQDEDFWYRRKYNCEGALAFLNDSIQELVMYNNMDMLNFLRRLFEIHNVKVPASRKINLGAVTVSDMNDQHKYKTNYQNTWDAFKTEIFDRLGGHIRIRFVAGDDIPRFDYLANYPKTATQEINFGNNLLDFSKNWDLSQLATVILPRGKQLEEEVENSDGEHDYVTIESVNNNSKYLANTDALNTFGRIEQVVDFDNAEDPTTLLNLATIYLSSVQFDSMQLNVSAIDLHSILDLSTTNKAFDLLDEVRCISKPHGMNRLFPITKVSIPLNDPSGTKYTMGEVVSSSLSSKSVASAKNLLAQLANMPSFTNLLDVAKENATQILNSATTGYVNIIVENDTSQALVITDTPNIEDATKMWKFNMNGLGYSRNGGARYDLAITMDGTIVADFIKTGILSDGYGLNYWNLSTGEFSLAYNAAFMNQSGNSITIVDVVSLAQDGRIVADTANQTAIIASRKQSGATNILNGTNKLLKIVDETSSWSESTWDGKNGISATKTIIDVTDAPNPNIIKGVRITGINSDSYAASHIVQRNVSLAQDQAYIMSCYAKGTGKLQMMAGNVIGSQPMYVKTTSSNLTSSWKRYSYAFKTGINSRYSSNLAGIINNNVDVLFGIYGLRSDDIQICGFKLERGNTATDWSESVKDAYESSTDDSAAYTNKASAANKQYTDATKTQLLENDTKVQNNAVGYTNKQHGIAMNYTDKNHGIAVNYTDKNHVIAVDHTDRTSSTDRKYTHDTAEQLKVYSKEYSDDISANDREFTKNQRIALDESFTQAKIFNRLTNNGMTQGIWLSNGRLYLNASYMTTGALNAGIITAGILRDRDGINKWNIATGYLTTRNMEATNINASGAISSGSYYKLWLNNGAIDGYRNGSWVGSITPTASIWNRTTERIEYGLSIRAVENLDIRVPELSIRNYNDSGTSIIAYTGKWNNTYVTRIQDLGGGAIQWSWQDHGVEFINGIATCVW